MRKSRKSTEGSPPLSESPGLTGNKSGVKALLEQFERQIGNDVKVSVTEYIRLVQLDRELKAEEPHDVEVIWTERLENLCNDGV